MREFALCTLHASSFWLAPSRSLHFSRVARRLRRAVGLPERDGVLVRAVESGSAAERAGLERGDLIVAAGTREIDQVDALYDVLDAARQSGELELTIVRGTDESSVSVDLAAG